MGLENSNDDLEMLKQRYLQRLQADAVTADNAPQRNLGMSLATGLMDLGEKTMTRSNLPLELQMGRVPGSISGPIGPTNNQAKYIQGVKDQQTAARQRALEDISPISTIQSMIDKKDAIAKEALQRGQDLNMKGWAPGVNGTISMIPGGAAATDIADKKSQAEQRKAMADYYKPGGTKSTIDLSKGTQMERQANNIHQQVLKQIKGDPVIRKNFGSYSQLSNAFNNFQNADHTNPAAFDELQQSVRAALGAGRNSAIGEREHTTMNSLGLNVKRTMEFLTGNPQDLAKDNAFAKHLSNLVDLEQKNIKSQSGKRLDALVAGHESMYNKYPDLKQDLSNAAAASNNQFSTEPSTNRSIDKEHQDALDWLKLNGSSPDAPGVAARLKTEGYL